MVENSFNKDVLFDICYLKSNYKVNNLKSYNIIFQFSNYIECSIIFDKLLYNYIVSFTSSWNVKYNHYLLIIINFTVFIKYIKCIAR